MTPQAHLHVDGALQVLWNAACRKLRGCLGLMPPAAWPLEEHDAQQMHDVQQGRRSKAVGQGCGAHLAAGRRLVGVGVVHLGDVDQLDLAAHHRAAHVPAGRVAVRRHADHARSLRHAVALKWMEQYDGIATNVQIC